MKTLLNTISKCDICADYLPLGPRPVVKCSEGSRILIIGQAPGTKVHASGIPWNDQSGIQLRKWLNVTEDEFYDTSLFGIMPMGFCYPGKGKSGDLPPRKECAPKWHALLLEKMPNLRLIILIGKYAQDYYLAGDSYPTLTKNVRNFDTFLPRYFVLPHPSPRNGIWLKKNAWFDEQVIPHLREEVKKMMA